MRAHGGAWPRWAVSKPQRRQRESRVSTVGCDVVKWSSPELASIPKGK